MFMDFLKHPHLCGFGKRGSKQTSLTELIAHSAERWKNTVDKNVWSQPAEGLGFQDKGFGLHPAGNGSQRRLQKRVDLMKEFFIHYRKAPAQLIFLLRKQSENLALTAPPVQWKAYTSACKAPRGGGGQFVSSDSEHKTCFPWHQRMSMGDACP